MTLKEPQGRLAVAHQQVLGLLIMIEHHAMGFAPVAGLLVASKGRMRGIEMIAIHPDPTGLYVTPHLIGGMRVSGPDAGTQPIETVICNREGFLFVLESCDGNHRAKDFLLENPHAVVSFEHGRFHIVAF